MERLGRCALCDREGMLQESHLRLPKFVYKRLRNPGAKNPHPVQISAKGTLQTSAQYVRNVLCSDCENRFGRQGEDWVARACLRHDNQDFPLLGALRSSKHHIIIDEAAAFYTHDNASVNHEALKYFAASMVWRGQHTLAKGRPEYGLHRYESQFRKYLLGESPFPRDASLFIFIRYRSNLTQLSHGVRASYEATATSYNFSIPGLTFHTVVGEFRDYRLRKMSFNENPLRPIMDAVAPDEANDALLRQIRANSERPDSFGRK